MLTLSCDDDETPVEQSAGAVRLTYGVEPAGAATAERTAQVMRDRLAAAGIDDADVTVASDAQPDDHGARRASGRA